MKCHKWELMMIWLNKADENIFLSFSGTCTLIHLCISTHKYATHTYSHSIVLHADDILFFK